VRETGVDLGLVVHFDISGVAPLYLLSAIT
jgi:hypothetical protein